MTCYFVYLLTNHARDIFYVGITNDLVKRITEHRQETRDGFTKRYGISRLVYYECYNDLDKAMRREKRLKRWNREWKIEMIENVNPEWNDLYNLVCEICAQSEGDPRVRSLRSLSGELCTQ